LSEEHVTAFCSLEHIYR